MGGGSSNEQKPNEINKDAIEQLKQQQNNPNIIDPKNNMQNSKVQQNSNINQNFSQNPNDKNNTNNKSSLKNPQTNQTNPNNPNSSNVPNKQNNQSNLSLNNQLKETLKKINKTGQTKISVSIFRYSPTPKFPNFKNLQQIQSNYQSSWNWKFDEKQKKWNFILQEPQSTGVQFMINQLGQFIKGDQNQWMLLNQNNSKNSKIIDKKTYFEQFTDLSFQNQSHNLIESMKQLQNNRKKLYKVFNQQYVDRFAEFPQIKIQKPQQKKASFVETYTHFIKKKFETKSKQWLMTVQILQNTDQFSCCMLWRTDSKDKAQLITQLLEEEKRLLQLRKQIYVHQMNILKI